MLGGLHPAHSYRLYPRFRGGHGPPQPHHSAPGPGFKLKPTASQRHNLENCIRCFFEEHYFWTRFRTLRIFLGLATFFEAGSSGGGGVYMSLSRTGPTKCIYDDDTFVMLVHNRFKIYSYLLRKYLVVIFIYISRIYLFFSNFVYFSIEMSVTWVKANIVVEYLTSNYKWSNNDTVNRSLLINRPHVITKSKITINRDHY